MRILIVGAGALGGYFGARLVAAGKDVTFLVRERRQQQLASGGLRVRSSFGDLDLEGINTVQMAQIEAPFDMVLLSCKAYDLDGAIASISPAMGPSSVVIPLLNGMKHMDILDRTFGAARVLGGIGLIAATLDAEGTVIHLNNSHGLTFGGRDPETMQRASEILEVIGGCNFDARVSPQIVQELWEKWVFLATLACSTSMMRATVGEILSAPGGNEVMQGIFAECVGIATASGYAPRATFLEQIRPLLTTAGSPLTASMMRDLERGAPIEADHIVGDLIQREGPVSGAATLSPLRIAYTHLKAYEARRMRGK